MAWHVGSNNGKRTTMAMIVTAERHSALCAMHAAHGAQAQETAQWKVAAKRELLIPFCDHDMVISGYALFL